MCEQTEINYLDGDIVWVKLGAYWWPGQVTGFDNLPDDIKGEFQKKPLIAAVKFFQEDTYEYVKNYQQIYKYNCTLKDEFIKKGLDKYRRGDSYMNKFPGDVEMAEKLTGGDPDILNSEKFSPEEKPDISALFGEKKISKKKKDRDDLRRSDGADVLRKITHPRFLRESDHEVRIRQQPSSLPSTPNNSASPQYPCHMCNFTSSRVNVIICHIKSHRSDSSPVERSRVRTYTQPRSRIVDVDTPKRKYVRKEKSHMNKSKTESSLETGKRKQPKQSEKASKKKKTDPEIREKLLADWDDESDEDISFDQNKSLNSDLLDVSSVHDESADNKIDEQLQDSTSDDAENNDILAESEKLLKETEKLSTIHMMEDSITNRNDSKGMDVDTDKSDSEKTSKSPVKSESVSKSQWQKENLNSDSESKSTGDDKKSRLSCFDFDEDDLPEPSIPPVRKIPRVFGEKNLSLKKEIIKEFEMSQALKIEQDKDADIDKQTESKSESNAAVKSNKSLKSSTEEVNEEIQERDDTIEDKITEEETIANKNEVAKVESKTGTEDVLLNDNQQKATGSVCETELEIVEIFEVEREEGEDECIETTTKTIIEQSKVTDAKVNETESKEQKNEEEKSAPSKLTESKEESPTQDIAKSKLITESNESTIAQDTDEALSEKFTTETEDETVSESADTLHEQSEISDIDQADLMNTARNVLPESGNSVATEKVVRKRRGRPRKNESTDSSRSGSQVENARDKRIGIIEKMDIDRKTSESDTERSYSGRKRKPNKKYLQSDIYIHDTDQKAFKTDESMSESEEKIPEKPKSKRRGRRSSKFHENLDSPAKLKNQEIELSDKLLRTAKDDTRIDSKQRVTAASEVEEGKKVVGLEQKLTESKDDSTSTSQDTTETAMEISEEVNENNVQNVAKSPIVTGTADKLLSETKSPQVAKKEEIDEPKNEGSVVNDQQETKKLSASCAVAQDSSDDTEAQKMTGVSKSSREMLPPKKSQIKKFEQSKTEFFDDDTSSAKSVAESEPEKKIDKGADTSFDHTKVESNEEMEEPGEAENATTEKINLATVTKEMIVHTIIGDSLITPSEILSQEHVSQETKQEDLPDKVALESSKEEKADKIAEESSKQAKDGSPSKVAMQTRYKGKFTPETGNKAKKDKDTEEKPVNTFQEAFLKTLQMDKKGTDDTETLGKIKKGKKPIKKQGEESDNTNTTVPVTSLDEKDEKAHDNSSAEDKASATQSESVNSETSAVHGLERMEVDVHENVEIQIKQSDSIVQSIDQSTTSSVDPATTTKQEAQLPKTEENSKTVSLESSKTDESKKVSTPSPTSDVTVPVKKREMPRIIENVTLTEPMQILKTKLLDKLPVKGTKHKLESDAAKKGGPRTKIMKIEPTASNSKMRTGMKVTAPHMSLSKKLQVLKAEEGEITSNVESQKETLNIQAKQTVTARPVIQQSSQSLSEMELDINSMPFVLSEDVLTPESIEQMPVVISSILPSSTSLPSTISFTPTTQIITTNQTQFKLANENPPDVSPKKKSGTPAILKNKSRAKPTITSIKTLVPPLTGGVKGLKFQNTQPGKTQPVLTQKAAPGKYVVVQASGGQQLRYSVQGKPGTPQKIAIPAGKNAGNAQVVQQGGKVVILTSAQSGQTKMLPLNISKTLSSKVQRIVTTKGQIFCPISPQNIISSKTIIAPKGDPGSSTTTKLPPGHKIINTQGIITSKGVLTPISGTIGKSAILGLPQGILTKGGIYTPISAPTLGTKTIIGSKTLVTKGTTVLSPQSLGTSKAIFTPITQALTAKTILGTQSIVGPRGTVLTPITGQQVKAIAAKSPSKGTKVQYQPVQQKIQLPVLQKNQKVPMSSSSQGRVTGALKSPAGTLVLQNTATPQKGTQFTKKIVKQTIVQQCGSVQSASPQTSAQHSAASSSPRIQQKGRGSSVSGVQKVIVPRGGRQTKAQQQIVVQKIQEPIVTAAQNIQLKQTVGSATTMPTITKTLTHQKHNVSSTATPGKSTAKTQVMNKTAMQQKNVLNVALNSATAATTTNVNLTTPLSLPPLEPIEPEKVAKIDETTEESIHKEQPPATTTIVAEKPSEVEKVVEPKVASQPQIMALPTESTDGTQTYVLVTIDEQGQIQPLDNNTLMSLEGTTQNPDGTRTLYIDPSSLGEAGTLDNIVLQFDNGALPNVQNNVVTEASQAITESFPTSEIVQTSNQDILAAALANTDFQQEINLPENPTANVMTTGLTQTSLINQTILQSTIIPPTEPISSPSVLETSLTLNQPIMTPLEVPSNLPIQAETTPTTVVSTIPSSLELPITITNPNISYIAAGEAQIQIPGNSMPDIGEIMENPSTVEISQAEMPVSTQYLVIPNLDETITVEAQGVQNNAIDMPTVTYSVSIPSEIALQPTQAQTTPSMPIIDDTYAEDTQYATSVPSAIVPEQSFIDVPVSEMLVSKASDVTPSQDITVTSEMTGSSQEVPVSTEESKAETSVEKEKEEVSPSRDAIVSEDIPVTSAEINDQQPMVPEDSTKTELTVSSEADKDLKGMEMIQSTEQTAQSNSMPIIDEGTSGTSESTVQTESAEQVSFEVTDSSTADLGTCQEADTVCELNRLISTAQAEEKLPSPAPTEQVQTSNQSDAAQERQEEVPGASTDVVPVENMEVEEGVESAIYPAAAVQRVDDVQSNEPSSEVETDQQRIHGNVDLHMEETNTETTSQETPSQSYEQFDVSMTSDSGDLPSQSATKSENSREPSQSIAYEPMETDEDAVSAEPPTQSFEHSKRNEASQSYDSGSAEANTNAPTQSFNEIAQSQDGSSNVDEAIDDQSFPTQSYDVGKMESLPENLETDAEISQEGNIPSQSNDIGTDGIGTSSVSTNNSGLNEDETASSSYVPETPENQERDQDQESAISTSSYEIPPCEELNIASSSVIPDTSVSAEHTSIHNNGIPEIPTSSYNLNPDITSTHVDSVPTSSYEEHVLVEQNVSTSYDVPISMPGLEETSSQNFVTESTDHRNEPSSYYAHHQEVTASYYEPVDQETNSRLERDAQEEVTPSYYERNPQEASQSYFAPEEATPSYTEHSVSPSYYDHGRPESEASQSYYPADDLEKTDQSPSQNIEASQSFYQERTDDLRLRQQGEATPTYSERYPVDYTLENSPIERHDLVESSVPATRPTER